MKNIILSGLFTFIIIAGSEQVTAQSTKYFEFHNDYWINLHHFLYQKAKGSQLKKLQEDGYDFRKTNENTVVLNSNDEEILSKAILYYKKNLINKSLRRDLGDIRIWLQQQDEQKIITDTAISQTFTNILNDVSEVYRVRFWPIHKELNQNVLNNHIEVIRLLE